MFPDQTKTYNLFNTDIFRPKCRRRSSMETHQSHAIPRGMRLLRQTSANSLGRSDTPTHILGLWLHPIQRQYCARIHLPPFEYMVLYRHLKGLQVPHRGVVTE